VLSGAPVNALAESESTLVCSRGAWEDLEVLRSIGEVYRSVREVCVCLLDRFPLCWCSSIVIKDWGDIMGIETTISIRLIPAAPKLSNFPAGVWQTGDCSIHDWEDDWIDNWCNYQKYRFIIPRPVPGELLTIVFTHPLPSNVGIYIGDDKATWLNKEIGRGVTTHRYWQRPVTRGFFLVVFWIYTSSEWVKEAWGQWNWYQHAQVSSS